MHRRSCHLFAARLTASRSLHGEPSWSAGSIFPSYRATRSSLRRHELTHRAQFPFVLRTRLRTRLRAWPAKFFRDCGGTDGSNPLPSSGESGANLIWHWQPLRRARYAHRMATIRRGLSQCTQCRQHRRARGRQVRRVRRRRHPSNGSGNRRIQPPIPHPDAGARAWLSPPAGDRAPQRRPTV